MWPSWAFRPKESYGFCGRKATLNRLHTVCEAVHHHRHHKNDSCIKMGSDESHFNVSLVVGDKVARQSPQTTTFED